MRMVTLVLTEVNLLTCNRYYSPTHDYTDINVMLKQQHSSMV